MVKVTTFSGSVPTVTSKLPLTEPSSAVIRLVGSTRKSAWSSSWMEMVEMPFWGEIATASTFGLVSWTENVSRSFDSSITSPRVLMVTGRLSSEGVKFKTPLVTGT
jgi:hypothetical protein